MHSFGLADVEKWNAAALWTVVVARTLSRLDPTICKDTRG